MNYPPKLIEATAKIIQLQDLSFIEKDLFVTDVIKAMGKVKSDDFELIFIGGTCLSKAHKIVQRMSEDIDFVLSPRFEGTLNNSTAKKKISEFRHQLLESVKKETGLSPRDDQIIKGNGNQFTRILLDYPKVYEHNSLLRKEIKIELTAKRMHLPTEQHPVNSLVDQAMQTEHSTEGNKLTCISLTETAADKWTALCKRIGESETKKRTDPSLIRHLYDLSCIQRDSKINEHFEQLVPMVLLRDRQQRKGQNPELYTNPLSEMNRGLNILKNNQIWEKHYHDFIENMVFQHDPPTFKMAMNSFVELHQRAINAIEKSPTFQSALNKETQESISKKPLLKNPQKKIWTPEQEKRYHTIVQKHIQFKRDLKKSPDNLELQKASLHHAQEISTLPNVMQYIKENFRGMMPEFTAITQAREVRFDKIIQKYEALQKKQENNTSAFSTSHKNLEKYAAEMATLPKLMQYIEKKSPALMPKIRQLAQSHERNKTPEIER